MNRLNPDGHISNRKNENDILDTDNAAWNSDHKYWLPNDFVPPESICLYSSDNENIADFDIYKCPHVHAVSIKTVLSRNAGSNILPVFDEYTLFDLSHCRLYSELDCRLFRHSDTDNDSELRNVHSEDVPETADCQYGVLPVSVFSLAFFHTSHKALSSFFLSWFFLRPVWRTGQRTNLIIRKLAEMRTPRLRSEMNIAMLSICYFKQIDHHRMKLVFCQTWTKPSDYVFQYEIHIVSWGDTVR